LHVTNTGNVLGDVLGTPLRAPTVYRTAESHLAFVDDDFNVRRVNIGVVGEPVVEVLPDALIRTGISTRTAPAVTAQLIHLAASFSVFIAHP